MAQNAFWPQDPCLCFFIMSFAPVPMPQRTEQLGAPEPCTVASQQGTALAFLDFFTVICLLHSSMDSITHLAVCVGSSKSLGGAERCNNEVIRPLGSAQDQPFFLSNTDFHLWLRALKSSFSIRSLLRRIKGKVSNLLDRFKSKLLALCSGNSAPPPPLPAPCLPHPSMGTSKATPLQLPAAFQKRLRTEWLFWPLKQGVFHTCKLEGCLNTQTSSSRQGRGQWQAFWCWFHELLNKSHFQKHHCQSTPVASNPNNWIGHPLFLKVNEPFLQSFSPVSLRILCFTLNKWIIG